MEPRRQTTARSAALQAERASSEFGPFAGGEAGDVLRGVVQQRDQLRLPRSAGVVEFGEVRVQDLERSELRLRPVRQQVRARTRRVNGPPDRARLRPRNPAPEREIPEPMQPLHDLPVHPVAVRLPKLRRSSPVAVLRVRLGDRLQRRL